MSTDDVGYKACLVIELQEQQKEIVAQIKRLKAELLPIVELAGGTWSDDDTTARIATRKGSVSYDAKALDALRASMPKIARVIEPHRKVGSSSTYITIRRIK